MDGPGESNAKQLAAKGMQRLPFDKLELLQKRGFLDEAFCAELITMIDAKRRPSTLADFDGDMYFPPARLATCHSTIRAPSDSMPC